MLWSGLHRLAVIPFGGVTVITAYPLIPWFAVMALGFCFCFGSIMKNEPAARQQITLRLGLATTAAFIGLRWLNIYGDLFAVDVRRTFFSCGPTNTRRRCTIC